MTTPQEPLVLDAVLVRNERANRKVDALCDGRERWVMRVPAQPNRDPDLVISASLSDVPALVTELTQARDEAAELRAALKQLLANPYPLTFTGDPLSHREGRARHEAAMRAARAALAATEGEQT